MCDKCSINDHQPRDYQASTEYLEVGAVSITSERCPSKLSGGGGRRRRREEGGKRRKRRRRREEDQREEERGEKRKHEPYLNYEAINYRSKKTHTAQSRC